VDTTFNIKQNGDTFDYRQGLGLRAAESVVAILENKDAKVHGPAIEGQRPPNPGIKATVYSVRALDKNMPLAFTLSNLPYRARWPIAALLIGAGIIALWGASASIGARPKALVADQSLKDQREHLLGRLVKLRRRQVAGQVSSKEYDKEHSKLVQQLVRIWEQ
jgi:hypothetical protein